MATRNIVPRATGEGSLGTSAKHWGNIYADNGIIAGRNIANDGATLTTHETEITDLQNQVTTLEHAYAGAKAAATVADMTDHNQIYVYVGSETGYTNGNWYYWNGTAWTSGGVYNATALETDKTLSVSGAAADANMTGNLLTPLANKRSVTLEIVNGGFYTTTGNFTASEVTSYTSPFAVGPGEQVTAKCRLYASWASTLLICSESGDFIQSVGSGNNTVSEYTYTNESSGIIFMRACGYDENGITVSLQSTYKTVDTLSTTVKKLPILTGTENLRDVIHFVVGNVYNGKEQTNSSRISTSDIITAPYDIIIPEMDNVKVKISLYNDGAFSSESEVALPYIIPAWAEFKLSLIQRYTTDNITNATDNALYNEFSAFNTGVYTEPIIWVNGSVDSAGNKTYTKSYKTVRTDIIKCNGPVKFIPNTGYKFLVCFYKNGGKIIETEWHTNGFIATQNADSFICVIASVDGSEVSLLNANTCIEFEHIPTNDPIKFFVGGMGTSGQANQELTRLHSESLVYDYDVIVQLQVPGYKIAVREFDGAVSLSDPDWQKRDFTVSANTEFVILLIADDQSDLSAMIESASSIIAVKRADESAGKKLPSYYFDNDYLQNKCSTIKGLIDGCAANGDAFFFITDLHYTQGGSTDTNVRHSSTLIKYIADNVNVRKIFCGGDTDDGCQNLVLDEYRKEMHDNPIDIYATPGNHEYSYGTKNNENAVYYAFNMYNNNATGSSERNYYYVDNRLQKIRYILLNGWKENTGGSVVGYETAQLDWLKDSALNVKSGWTIIVITHSIFDNVGTTFQYTNSSAEAAANIIKNYSGDGVIAGVFQGHTHRDRIIKIGSVPVIVTACDKWKQFEDNEFDVERTPLTTSEQVFDVAILDKNNRKWTIVRIGAKAVSGVGLTDVGDSVEYREVTY